MVLVFITLALIAIGVAAFLWGTVSLAKYGFRVSVPVGLAVLLFPPYTFYFAFFRLEEEGKETPTASWLGGMLVSVLLILLFMPTLGHVVRGNWDQLRDAEGPGEVAQANQNGENGESENGEDSDDAEESDESGSESGSEDSDSQKQASADNSDDDNSSGSSESGEDGESSGESSGSESESDSSQGESGSESE